MNTALADAPEDDDLDEICATCNGCGEGQWEGSTCFNCKGTGCEPGQDD